jgi:hypothetical protein
MATSDPLEARLEALFERPLPTELVLRIDRDVEAMLAGDATVEPGVHPAVERSRPPAGIGRRRTVVLLAWAALVLGGAGAIAGTLWHGGPPPANPALSRAMQGFRERSMAECLSEQEARASIASTLRDLGVTEWSIRTDGGVSYPVGQHDAYLRHTDRGCYVYGGNGWDADGRPVYYIGGPGSVDGSGT